MGVLTKSYDGNRLNDQLHQGCHWRTDPEVACAVRVSVLTTKYKGMEAIIDASDLPLLQGKRLNWSPGKVGREISGGSLVFVINGTPKVLARVILNVVDSDRQVSHVNGNRLDCRRENLVVVTRSEVARARQPSPVSLAQLAPYPDPNRPGVWRVPLKSYKTSREVLIDDADLPIVRGRNWNWSTRSEDGRTTGVVVLATTGKQLPLHRMILGVVDRRTRVSFVNGDALDCRRGNLAIRTLAETARHSRKKSTQSRKVCTSLFKGICRDGPRGKWLAQIRKGRVYLYVGRFDSEIEAAQAYDAAARSLFGTHGRLNFPDQPSTPQALSDARSAMDTASDQERARRQHQREMEKVLRRAAAEPACINQIGCEETTAISSETARRLFDVTPSVWMRWQSFCWIPTGAIIDGMPMHPLVEIERLLLRCGIVALPYPDPLRPNVYRVPLSGATAQGREALIDADAVPLVRTTRWRFAETDSGRGGEVQTMIPSENIRLHYVVLGITRDTQLHIGHRNDDPLDCRRANLVIRTPSDTSANHRKQATFCGRPCTSQFKGVFKEKRSGHWVATIKKDRVQRRLGTFRDEVAAAQVYDEAARELFGEHARLNFPRGVDVWLERLAA